MDWYLVSGLFWVIVSLVILVIAKIEEKRNKRAAK
jgi:hypothetical protein